MRPANVVTPEASSLALDVAGIGSRMIAAIIDGVIQFVVGLSGILAIGVLPEGVVQIGVSIAWVLFVAFGYFAVFEGLWDGQTPGKRVQRLRVVTVDGQPVTFSNALLRNIVRIVDFLPGGYAIGVITMLVSPKEQRLGDLAAGTLVVRTGRAAPPMPLEFDASPAALAAAPRLDVTRLRPEHEQLARAFLQRRDPLDPAARAALAAEVATALRTAVAGGDGVAPEVLIEAVALASRRRAARARSV